MKPIFVMPKNEVSRTKQGFQMPAATYRSFFGMTKIAMINNVITTNYLRINNQPKTNEI
jgi:uncharacterized membrane protein YwaF